MNHFGFSGKNHPRRARGKIGMAIAVLVLLFASCSEPFHSALFDVANTRMTLHVKGIILDRQVVTLPPLGSVQLSAVISPDNAVNKNVAWESSDDSLATVSSGGFVVAGPNPGFVTIRATSQDRGLSATSAVTISTVSVAVNGVSVNPPTLNLLQAGTAQLAAIVSPSNAANQAVTWSSSDASLATVSPTGLVTALSGTGGPVTITASSLDGGFVGTSLVTLTTSVVSVTGIVLNLSTVTLAQGATDQMIATISPANATNIEVNWTSSNASVATVSSTGMISAVAGSGSAVISGTTVDGGFVASCTITISDWQIVGGGSISTMASNYYSGVTLAIGPGGNPYIAYRESTGKGLVKKFSGGSWNTVGGGQFSSNFAVNNSGANNIGLAIDSSDTPYIAFQDGAHSGKISVKKVSSGNWVYVGSAGISMDTATYISIVIDGTTPYIGFVGLGTKISGLTFDGSNWVAILDNSSIQFSAANSSYVSLATHSGNIYVAIANDNARLREVFRFTGSGPSPIGFNPSGPSVKYNSLTTDSAGNLYLAYQDSNSGSRPFVVKSSGGAWTILGGSSVMPRQARFESLVIGLADTPYVVFQDVVTGMPVLEKFDGTAWALVGASSQLSVQADSLKLAVDSAGHLFLAYETSSTGTIKVLELQ